MSWSALEWLDTLPTVCFQLGSLPPLSKGEAVYFTLSDCSVSSLMYGMRYELDLDTCLSKYTTFACSDPRDRLCGLLGLIRWPQNVGPILPDYEISSLVLALQLVPYLKFDHIRTLLRNFELTINDQRVREMINRRALRRETTWKPWNREAGRPQDRLTHRHVPLWDSSAPSLLDETDDQVERLHLSRKFGSISDDEDSEEVALCGVSSRRLGRLVFDQFNSQGYHNLLEDRARYFWTHAANDSIVKRTKNKMRSLRHRGSHSIGDETTNRCTLRVCSSRGFYLNEDRWSGELYLGERLRQNPPPRQRDGKSPLPNPRKLMSNGKELGLLCGIASEGDIIYAALEASGDELGQKYSDVYLVLRENGTLFDIIGQAILRPGATDPGSNIRAKALDAEFTLEMTIEDFVAFCVQDMVAWDEFRGGVDEKARIARLSDPVTEFPVKTAKLGNIRQRLYW